MTQAIPSAVQPQSFPSFKKLSTEKIFEEITERICLVLTGKRPSTGLLLGENYLLVASQVLGVREHVRSRDNLPCVDISYRNVRYTAEYAIHLRLNVRENGQSHLFVPNLCLCRIKDHDFPPQPSCSVLTEDPKPGEKVYFGGYGSPSQPDNETFHQGMVSSVDEEVRQNRHERAAFTIDGTLVPGNLGAPVFIQREGKLNLAGIIITDTEDDFAKTKKALEPMLKLSINGVSMDETVSAIVSTVFNNFSQGFGRVIHAKHVAALLENSKTQLASKDPIFLEWFHGYVEGTKLCKEILGSPLFGPSCGEKFKPEEEQKLVAHYQQRVFNNPHHEFHIQRPKPLDQFSLLEQKIRYAVPERDSDYLPIPKALRLNVSHWLGLLGAFNRTVPEKTEEIEKLVHLITKKRVPDTRQIGYC